MSPNRCILLWVLRELIAKLWLPTSMLDIVDAMHKLNSTLKKINLILTVIVMALAGSTIPIKLYLLKTCFNALTHPYS